MDIADWLRGLGLEQYEAAFRANDIAENVLPSLTAEDLKELGVASVGHRRRLLSAITMLRSRIGHDGHIPTASLTDRRRLAATPDAERRHITVMFCDIVGSTALATRLDPEDLREVIGAYHRCCTDVIHRHNGIVSRYMGDGVLAYFGYPQAHEDDAEQAVRAGLAIVDAIDGLQTGIDTRLQVRVGIATGTVVVGDLIGGGEAQERSVVGQTPNLAARLQALAEPNTVVIAASTRRLARGLFEYRDLGKVVAKGLGQVQAWQVLAVSAAESRFEAQQHERVLTPLVGRDEELGFLLHRWTRAIEGDGSVVLLSGEPGIGKSRIWRALRERLAGQHYVCLRHYCSSHHQNSSLYPIISTIEREAGFAPRDTVDQKVAKLERLLADSARDPSDIGLILDLLSLPTGDRYRLPELSPQRRKQKTMEVLLANLQGSWAQEPVLVVFEDVHWIDPTSLELLGTLIESVCRQRVLLLITARPQFHAPWRAQAHFFTISLNRLGPSKAMEVAEQVAGDKRLPQEVLKEILARTDGVPLFIEELTKAVIEGEVLREQGERDELREPQPTPGIPATLHDSLMARLDRLEGVAEVARIGSVIGREFSYELLSAAAGLPQHKLDAALARLIQSELVFRLGETRQSLYGFKHALVRDAVYNTLLRSKRQQLHAKISTVLEREFPDIARQQPELLAHHCTLGGLTETAVAYWEIAGRKSAARSAMIEAAAQFNKGLSLLPGLPDNRERWLRERNLQSGLGAALYASKGPGTPETGQAYGRARELCEELGDTATLMPILSGLWSFHSARSEYTTAGQIAADMLRLAERQNDPAGLLVGSRSMGTCLFLLGKIASARKHFEDVLALYDPELHRSISSVAAFDPRAAALSYLSWNDLILGYPDQALTRSEQALSWSSQLGHPHTLGYALTWAAIFNLLRRAETVTLELLEKLSSLAIEQKFPHFLAASNIMRGHVLVTRGEAAQALQLAKQGFADLRATGLNWNRTYFLGLLAQSLVMAGQADEANALLVEAIETADSTGEQWFKAELHRLIGECLIALGRRDSVEVDACFQRALEIAKEQDAKFWELRAAINLSCLRHRGTNRAEGHELIASVYSRFTEGFDLADLQDAKKLLEELR